MVSYHHSLKGGRLCRVTVINGSNDLRKQLSVTILNRANSSMRSQKTPAVSWFDHLDFTREEPGTIQKGIELWDSFGENTAFIGYRKRLARLPSIVWVVATCGKDNVTRARTDHNKIRPRSICDGNFLSNIVANFLFRTSCGQWRSIVKELMFLFKLFFWWKYVFFFE